MPLTPGGEIDHAYLRYDALGRPLVKDTLNARFTYGYDLVDRLLSEQALGGAVNLNTSFVYDAAGHRIGLYSQGVLTSATYDAADQLISTQVPLSGLTYQINCGGSASTPFSADSGFSSASTMYTATTASAITVTGIPNPAPQACYQSQRYLANFSPSPLYYVMSSLTPGGSYRIRLHWATFGDGSTGQRFLNVAVNGVPVLTHLDVYAAAGGDLRAIVKEVGGVADAAGNLVLSFTSDPGYLYVSPFINAIEVILERVQINCGGAATGSFLADAYYSSLATMYTTTTASAIDLSGVSSPAPLACYQSLRYLANGSTAPLTYTLPGLTPGANYHVRLHWATFGDGGAQKRFVDVAINGTQVISRLDVYAAAGGDLKAIARDLYANADSTGTLTLAFTSETTATPPSPPNPVPVYVSPFVNAIEIYNSGQTSYLYDGNGSLVSAIHEHGLTPKHIAAIYSEWTPCVDQPNCSALLHNTFKDNPSYFASWTMGETSQHDRAIKAAQKDFMNGRVHNTTNNDVPPFDPFLKF